MSSRPTSASMLSMLPQPIQPIPGDSFNDRILLLLAAVATTDDMLTYREYRRRRRPFSGNAPSMPNCKPNSTTRS